MGSNSPTHEPHDLDVVLYPTTTHSHSASSDRTGGQRDPATPTPAAAPSLPRSPPQLRRISFRNWLDRRNGTSDSGSGLGAAPAVSGGYQPDAGALPEAGQTAPRSADDTDAVQDVVSAPQSCAQELEVALPSATGATDTPAAHSPRLAASPSQVAESPPIVSSPPVTNLPLLSPRSPPIVASPTPGSPVAQYPRAARDTSTSPQIDVPSGVHAASSLTALALDAEERAEDPGLAPVSGSAIRGSDSDQRASVRSPTTVASPLLPGSPTTAQRVGPGANSDVSSQRPTVASDPGTQQTSTTAHHRLPVATDELIEAFRDGNFVYMEHPDRVATPANNAAPWPQPHAHASGPEGQPYQLQATSYSPYRVPAGVRAVDHYQALLAQITVSSSHVAGPAPPHAHASSPPVASQLYPAPSGGPAAQQAGPDGSAIASSPAAAGPSHHHAAPQLAPHHPQMTIGYVRCDWPGCEQTFMGHDDLARARVHYMSTHHPLLLPNLVEEASRSIADPHLSEHLYDVLPHHSPQ